MKETTLKEKRKSLLYSLKIMALRVCALVERDASADDELVPERGA